MALVVTWNVTFPSVLVVVKTLVPAEADTATRGEVPEVTGALEDPLPVCKKIDCHTKTKTTKSLIIP